MARKKESENMIEYARLDGQPRFSEGYIRARKLEVTEREIRESYELRYRRVIEAFIRNPPCLEDVAKVAASAAAFELDINAPAIRAMDESEIRDAPNKWGYAPMRRENLIVVRMDQCPCRIATTAAHETRHRWQIDGGRFFDMLGAGISESDAEEFEARFAQKYFPSNGCHCKD